MKTVISLCDLTGNAVKPWVEAGYAAFLVDPQHDTTRTEGNITKFAGTIEDAMPTLGELIRTGDVAFVMGWPPCTDLAVSGARWFKPKMTDPTFSEYRGPNMWIDAMRIVEQCRVVGELSGAPYLSHHASPTKVKGERGNKRSITPMGFARAVFAANHRPALEVAA